MEIQEIDVFIAANGEVKLEVRGVKGPACQLATGEAIKALGGHIAHQEKTPEFDQSQSQSADQSLNLGR
jgi:hypothetical protein